MKKGLLSMLFLGVVCTLTAQSYQAPQVFRNHYEYVQYQLANPDRIPLKAVEPNRAFTAFSQKLDSVIGSDNFDWTRWKNIYTYGTDEERPYDDRSRTEIHLVWDRLAWQPELKSEYSVEGEEAKVLFSRWNGEDWENYSRVTYYYADLVGKQVLDSVLTESFADSAWVASSRITYEYGDQLRLQLVLNENCPDGDGVWMPQSKLEYTYDDEGYLVNKIHSSIRNDQWREDSKDTLVYDEGHRCVEMLTKVKGGFGPWGGGNWRDASKYEFTYANDGSLESETLYSAGWFGSGMTMEGKTNYHFDTQGNLVLKTVSINNGEEWIVRDQYENSFETSQAASAFLGLAPLWESTLNQGLGYVLDPMMPLSSQWLSCSIVSTSLDTQFDLYYSGFAGVQDHTMALLKAYSSEGNLVVENDSPSDITVYDLLGRVIVSEKQVLKATFRLKPGVYVVANDNCVVKTVVK